MSAIEPIVELEDFSRWAVLAGTWKLDEPGAQYVAPDTGSATPDGLLIGPTQLADGTIRVNVTFLDEPEPDSAARVVIGFDAETGAHFSIGLGGYRSLYLIDEFKPGTGWGAIRSAGNIESAKAGHTYELTVAVLGQYVALSVDGVEVMEWELPHPLIGTQVGLFSYGERKVKFSRFSLEAQAPNAFIVMQFGEPFDTLYEEVIRPVTQQAGFEAHRADDIYRPGVILRDIIQSIHDASVIIAEITPANPNVFYELGFAHARGKPTILLAEKDRELPFDISGFRCIFYDDSIGGKRRVEGELEKHLAAI